ncbi:hypothetical protein LINPERPRIM_LOCUS24679 [Linum perenne]
MLISFSLEGQGGSWSAITSMSSSFSGGVIRTEQLLMTLTATMIRKSLDHSAVVMGTMQSRFGK